MKIQSVNGFKDILPDSTARWRRVEEAARRVFARFGMREIRTPVLEKTELFVRSIGEATDVVEKEMYTFADKGISMRPEATASILRAFIEHGLHVRQPVHRLYTIGPMFRHERPQKGRLRQFHQLDAEIIGANEPYVDAELIAMGRMFLDELGLAASLEINSLGCHSCRPPYKAALVRFLEERADGLCGDCRRRLHANPLRALDCKNSGCRALVLEAPSLLDNLCPECGRHFQEVGEALDAMGIAFCVNRFMVRGLDYYTRTTFEFLTGDLGAQAAVGAGGRYDGLIEELGGPPLAGIGFAMGLERVLLLLEQKEKETGSPEEGMDLFLAAPGQEALVSCLTLAHFLRAKGMRVALDYSGRGLKGQLKQAARSGARYTLIAGEEEWARGEAVLRDMSGGGQRPFSLAGGLEERYRRLAGLLQGAEDGPDENCTAPPCQG